MSCLPCPKFQLRPEEKAKTKEVGVEGGVVKEGSRNTTIMKIILGNNYKVYTMCLTHPRFLVEETGMRD